MRDLLKQGVVTSLVLLVVAEYFPGLSITRGLGNFFWTGFGLALLNILVKPIIKLILLPLNLLTLGIFSWISQVLVIILGDKLIGPLTIVPVSFAAWQSGGFSIPSLQINLFFSYVIVSALMTVGLKLFKIIL